MPLAAAGGADAAAAALAAPADGPAARALQLSAEAAQAADAAAAQAQHARQPAAPAAAPLPLASLHARLAQVAGDVVDAAPAKSVGTFTAGSGHGDASQPTVVLASLSPGVAPGALQPATAAPEASATYSASLPSPVGSAPWGQELGQQVLLAVDSGLQSATLHLNPPQLGPLEVHLQLQGGQVNAQFASPHQAVREAVQGALPQLHDLFSGAGLSLGQASVSREGRGQPRSAPARSAAARSASIDVVGAQPTQPARWVRGLVNTYV